MPGSAMLSWQISKIFGIGSGYKKKAVRDSKWNNERSQEACQWIPNEAEDFQGRF